jgi:hypothetical protein
VVRTKVTSSKVEYNMLLSHYNSKESGTFLALMATESCGKAPHTRVMVLFVHSVLGSWGWGHSLTLALMVAQDGCVMQAES